MMPRDPRTDPRPGDVLRKGYHERTVSASDGLWNGFIHYDTRRMMRIRLRRSTWVRWAHGAEVIHVAEDA